MRSEKKIKEMMWLLDGDPDSAELDQVLTKFIDKQPAREDVQEYLKLVDNAMIYNRVAGLDVTVKKLEIIVWLLEDEELLKRVHKVPFSGYESLIEKGLIITKGLSFKHNGDEEE